MPDQAPPPPTAAVENPTAIVVSDNGAVRHAIASLLHDASYVTVAVSRFDDASLLLARRMPTVFILDVDLDDDEALELLGQMAASPSAPPTLVLSPSELEDRIAASFGVTVLRKPFEPRTLVAELVRCVEGDRRPRPAARSGTARPA